MSSRSLHHMCLVTLCPSKWLGQSTEGRIQLGRQPSNVVAFDFDADDLWGVMSQDMRGLVHLLGSILIMRCDFTCRSDPYEPFRISEYRSSSAKLWRMLQLVSLASKTWRGQGVGMEGFLSQVWYGRFSRFTSLCPCLSKIEKPISLGLDNHERLEKGCLLFTLTLPAQTPLLQPWLSRYRPGHPAGFWRTVWCESAVAVKGWNRVSLYMTKLYETVALMCEMAIPIGSFGLYHIC